MLFIRAGIHKMLVKIANREDPDSDCCLIWVCPVCLGLFGRQLVSEILEHLPLMYYSNAHAFVMQHLIGYKHKKFVTVCPAIYCRKLFEVINYVTFFWMTCSFKWLTTVQFETNCRSALEWGYPYSKISIWGGISLDIR